ncbi:YdeI/OmpD-associated family protein [Niabella insulamsoli]|uniref:YdeI/OmpD-associated family protein n=1 Tax=Niabella insulamsoli TaxID=3144874 RepID=UPI0031FBCB0F
MPAIKFTAPLKKFEKNGEKSGWTYIEVPAALAVQLKANNKKSFRVKGFLDRHAISGVTLLPVGDGNFIMAVNAAMRKGIGKRNGAMVAASLEADEKPYELNVDLVACLADDPAAETFFKTLAPSHQRYFSKWIDEAKTQETRVKRIAQALVGLSRKMDYGQMIRFHKGKV